MNVSWSRVMLIASFSAYTLSAHAASDTAAVKAQPEFVKFAVATGKSAASTKPAARIAVPAPTQFVTRGYRGADGKMMIQCEPETNPRFEKYQREIRGTQEQ